MSSHLRDSFVSSDAIREIFSDAAVLEAMLRFEAALARAEASAGVISPEVAATIASAAQASAFDAASIARQSWSSATLAVPLVDALRQRVASLDPRAAVYVHWGATSQDVVDTALVLCLQRAAAVLAVDHQQLLQGLRQQSETHARTIMLGRTLLQPATPITFGLKAASWFAAISRPGTHLFSQFDEAAVLQFGGGSGTLATLGDHGEAVSAQLAHELGLREPAAPWHAARDRFAALVAACGVSCGAIAKIARDVTLLMQQEVAEASAVAGRSSAMPHKRNPSGCAVALAAASRLPGLVATMLAGMAQEHERGVGGWIGEVSTVCMAVEATGAALAALVNVVGTLQIDSVRMRANLAAQDVVFAERALMLLAPALGRDAGVRVIDETLAIARRDGCAFADALAAHADVANTLTAQQLADLASPEPYIACADRFRRRLLSD